MDAIRPDLAERFNETAEAVHEIAQAFDQWAAKCRDNAANITNTKSTIERLAPIGIESKLERIERKLSDLKNRSANKVNASITGMVAIQEQTRRLEDSAAAFSEMLVAASAKRQVAIDRLAELEAEVIPLPDVLVKLLE